MLFEQHTEPPGSSLLDREKRKGTFVCRACNFPLFESSAKFDSGTRWPSFFRPIEKHVATKRDYSLIRYYRWGCGRDARLEELWGKDAPKH